MRRLNLSCDEFVAPYVVKLTNGTKIVGIRAMSGCPIEIEGRVWLADVIEIDMPDFDVILRIDWLDKHEAIIDCRKRRVQLRSVEG